MLLLSIIGISMSGILTAFSACVLAIGMALQNNIANLANGIIIVSSHMFKKGDYIIVDGVEGSIEEIRFLSTTIMTTDNKKITIPNSTILNSSVINAGANSTRRIDFTFSVAYESDVEQVKKIVKDVMLSDGRVRLDPAPSARRTGPLRAPPPPDTAYLRGHKDRNRWSCPPRGEDSIS